MSSLDSPRCSFHLGRSLWLKITASKNLGKPLLAQRLAGNYIQGRPGVYSRKNVLKEQVVCGRFLRYCARVWVITY